MGHLYVDFIQGMDGPTGLFKNMYIWLKAVGADSQATRRQRRHMHHDTENSHDPEAVVGGRGAKGAVVGRGGSR